MNKLKHILEHIKQTYNEDEVLNKCIEVLKESGVLD